MTGPAGLPAELVDELAGDAATIDGETMTITCSIDGCGTVITGARAGKGSALWKRGTHRFTKHGIRKGERPARPRGGAPTSDELAGADGARPVLAAVRDIADGMGGARKTSPPTADELARGLGRGLGLITVGAASLAVETDHGIPEGPAGDAIRERLVDQLSLTDKAAQGIMRPVGRMLADTRINAKHGRKVVENVDVIEAGAELAAVIGAWRKYFRDRAAGAYLAAAQMPTALSMYPAPMGAPASTSPFEESAAYAAAGLTTPAPQSGHVIGPEDVARAIQAQQARGNG